MSIKVVASGAVGVAAGILIGLYFGASRPIPPPIEFRNPAPDGKDIADLRARNDRLFAEAAGLRTANAKLESENTAMSRRLAAALQSPTPGASLPPVQQQRLIINNLRQISAAVDQYTLEKGHPPASLSELVDLEPMKYIRFLNTINGEDYAQAVLVSGQPLTVTTKDGLVVTYDVNAPAPVRGDSPDLPAQIARAYNVNTASFESAWKAYQAAHNSAMPPNPEALIPYFATPKEGADFAEAIEAHERPKN